MHNVHAPKRRTAYARTVSNKQKKKNNQLNPNNSQRHNPPNLQ